MRPRSPLPVALLAAATAAACGSSAPPADAGAGRDVGAEVDPDWVTSRPGEVYEGIAVGDAGFIPIPGAKVCVHEHPEIPCALADVDGRYTLRVPFLATVEPFAVTFAAEGHLGRVMPAGTSWWPGGVGLDSDEYTRTFASQAGFTYPAQGTSFIGVRLFARGVPTGLAGATVMLAPGSGKGPIYGDPQGYPDPALTSTSSSGIAYFGNVTPGRVTLTVKAEGRTCEAKGLTGIWLSSGPNTISLPAVADSATDDVPLFCVP
jgi:hypothetical protein